MTHQGHFAFETWISLLEKLIDAVALPQNDSSYVSFVCRALVQQYIQPYVSYQVANGRNAFNRDIIKVWIFLIGSIKITCSLLKKMSVPRKSYTYLDRILLYYV